MIYVYLIVNFSLPPQAKLEEAAAFSGIDFVALVVVSWNGYI
jgi:hypothetical protein